MPLTPAEFRRMARQLPETSEQSHQGHPDFRVGGKIFASLTHAEDRGMVKVPVPIQSALVKEHAAFEPATGAWGRAGCTMITLRRAKKAVVQGALAAAWRQAAPRRLLDSSQDIDMG